MLDGLRRESLAGLAEAVVGGSLVYRGLSGHCSFYATLGVSTTCHPKQTSVPAETGVRVDQSITINRRPEELYRFWRDFQNLPRFLSHLKSVEVTGYHRSRWTARALGMNLSWEAEVINEKEPSLIAWRSLEGSEVDTAGSVHFLPAPGGRGTEVRVELKYQPPAGKLGAALAWLFGDSAEAQIKEDLRRLKQIMEAGEVPTTRGQPSGRA